MSKHRTHSHEFKAKHAIEAISDRKTIQKISADHATHPIQISQWKRQLLDGASELFTTGKKTKGKEAELFKSLQKNRVARRFLPLCATAGQAGN